MKEGYNFPDCPAKGTETPTGKSETIPGQALSIREIMQRSMRGAILAEVSRNRLEYGDDEDFRDEMPTEVDLTDIDDTTERVSYLKGQIERARAAERENAERKQQDANPGESKDPDLPSPSAE